MATLYTTAYARDGFPAPDTREIDGRTADGAGSGPLALGTLDRDPTTLEGNSLGVSTQGGVTEGAAQSFARDLDNPMAKYKWNGLSGLAMDAHRVEMIPTFPAHDGTVVSGQCGLTSGTQLLHDDGSGSDVDSIDGETLTGGGATWQTPLFGSLASAQRISGEFTADPTPGGGGDGGAIATGSGIPDEGDYRVRVKGYFASFQNKDADGTPQNFGVLLRWADNNSSDIFKTAGFVAQVETAPATGANRYRLNIVGGTTVLIAGTLSLNTEYTLDVTISGRGFVCARLYDGVTLKGTAASQVTFAASRRYEHPYSPGFALISQYATVSELESERTVYVTDFEVLSIADEPPISGGISNEAARNDVAVRVSTDGLSGYFSRQYFDHFDVDPERYYEVGWRDGGTETILWRQTDHGAALTSAHDTPYPFSLAIDPDNHLHAYDGDTELIDFELGVDLADDTADVVPIFDPTDTTPGFAGFDANGFGWTDRPTSVTVYMGGDVCEGPPDNHYPNDPPTPPPPLPPRWFIRQGGKYLSAPVPSPDYPNSARLKDRALTRVINQTIGMAIRDRAKWRLPGPPIEEQPPPYEGPDPPPFSDPCEIADPPPIPDTPVEPLGDKVFLCGQMPATRISPTGVFNCASRSEWAGSADEADQALARGGFLQTTQGGYSQYFDGSGNYSQAVFDSVIDSKAPVLNALVAKANYAGHQFIDDWASSPRWPPSGISVTQMSHQTSYLHAAVPGLFLICRARVEQWSDSSYPTGIDGIMAQFRYWGLGGQTPAQFAAIQVAGCRRRGWKLELVINLTDGGSGGPNTQMTPSEVATAMLAFFQPGTGDVIIGGGVGFTYNGSGSWFDDPDYVNALALGRNALAAL